MWLAKLTEKGLLRPSFVPPVPVRQLRDYTRLRVDLTRERARYWQRMEKLLEDALIKVSDEQALVPDTSPPRESRQRRARSRAGRAFSRQIGLRQIGRCPAQYLILLLQQSNSTPSRPEFSGLSGTGTGPRAIIDIGFAHPLRQRHRMDTEIGGDLLQSDTVIAVASNAYDVVTELTGIRPGHNDILPARPNWASHLSCHLFVQQTQVLLGDAVEISLARHYVTPPSCSGQRHQTAYDSLIVPPGPASLIP